MFELLITVTVMVAVCLVATAAADRVPETWVDWFAEVLR